MKELVVVAGANGSGKTTFAKQLVIETGYAFLNADEIEKTLEPSGASSAKLMAGRLFFQHLNELVNASQSFILESPDVCIERIKNRVKLGGHFVLDVDVRRRYYRSKRNFWLVYKELADKWSLFNNPLSGDNQLVAVGFKETFSVESDELFSSFLIDIPQ